MHDGEAARAAAAASAATMAGHVGRRGACSNIAFRRRQDRGRTILRIAFIRRRRQPPTTCGGEMNCRCSPASLLTPANNTTNGHVLHSARRGHSAQLAHSTYSLRLRYCYTACLPGSACSLHLWPAGRSPTRRTKPETARAITNAVGRRQTPTSLDDEQRIGTLDGVQTPCAVGVNRRRHDYVSRKLFL